MRIALAAGVLYASIGLSFSQKTDALESYRKELEANPRSSLAHYRIADIFIRQRNYQSAANEFREALNGDLEPKWTEYWSHLNLAWIFDVTGQHERAVAEYARAERVGDFGQGEELAEYLMGQRSTSCGNLAWWDFFKRDTKRCVMETSVEYRYDTGK